MDLGGTIQALSGGMLIGLAATIILALDGKILGVSGIVGGLIDHKLKDRPWRWSFVLGMLSVGLLVHGFKAELIGSSPLPPVFLAGAGVLVGFGTRLGNGCTSGHGVCGISRWSIRSLAATLTFMATGAFAAWLIHT